MRDRLIDSERDPLMLLAVATHTLQAVHLYLEKTAPVNGGQRRLIDQRITLVEDLCSRFRVALAGSALFQSEAAWQTADKAWTKTRARDHRAQKAAEKNLPL